MENSKVIYRSVTSLTDTLHTISIAAPLFLILVGCYLLYRNVIENAVLRLMVLIGLLMLVAILAPLGGRLKHMEITESACRVIPSHSDPYEIEFGEIEAVNIQPAFGIVKIRLFPTKMLPGDSVWFIPETPEGISKRSHLEEVRAFLQSHMEKARG